MPEAPRPPDWPVIRVNALGTSDAVVVGDGRDAGQEIPPSATAGSASPVVDEAADRTLLRPDVRHGHRNELSSVMSKGTLEAPGSAGSPRTSTPRGAVDRELRTSRETQRRGAADARERPASRRS